MRLDRFICKHTEYGHQQAKRLIAAGQVKVNDLVITAEPINPEAEARFAAGIWLAREGVLTSPARLERISPCEALLTIYEGRHHQVKRMFAAIDNEVTTLHRESMGSIRLDPDLAPGQYRALTRTELRLD
jgi:16S rRNA pseudouridine516 synthase